MVHLLRPETIWRIIGITVAMALTIGSWSIHPTRAQAQIAAFHTPTGNIGCIAYSGHLRCDIGQRHWQARALPSLCQFVSGDSLTMSGTGIPKWTCHGDTALHLGPALPYGSTWHSGLFTCVSRFNGLTCTNRRGHGFFLSRESYRTF